MNIHEYANQKTAPLSPVTWKSWLNAKLAFNFQRKLQDFECSRRRDCIIGVSVVYLTADEPIKWRNKQICHKHRLSQRDRQLGTQILWLPKFPECSSDQFCTEMLRKSVDVFVEKKREREKCEISAALVKLHHVSVFSGTLKCRLSIFFVAECELHLALVKDGTNPSKSGVLFSSCEGKLI